MEIMASSGSAAYLELLESIIYFGERTSPREQPTRELRDVQLVIPECTQVHVLETCRHTSEQIAHTEALHLIAGISSLEQLDLASGGKFSQFADNGRLRGAYGPRAHHQLELIVNQLDRDPASRQAVVTIWNGKESSSFSRDVPCTLSYQFLLRGNLMHMRTSMRSNDAYLGLPYDLEVASALHRAVAWALGASPGSYTHAVGSMHLYERNFASAESIVAGGIVDPVRSIMPPVIDESSFLNSLVTPASRWASVKAHALVVCLGDRDDPRFRIPPLPSADLPWRVCRRCRYVVSGPCLECSHEEVVAG
jgi:thymidylate synthase